MNIIHWHNLGKGSSLGLSIAKCRSANQWLTAVSERQIRQTGVGPIKLEKRLDYFLQSIRD